MTDGGDTPRTPGAFFGPKEPGLEKREDVREADLGATWLARIGALALLVGAGFGFRYAIDRGLIGPGGRVALGVFVAAVLIALAEWTAARGWRPFSQAAAGGGVGLFYVTTWAAFRQYELIDARTAFFLLVATAIGAAALALRHDSQALAVLATLGAFANPIVAGASPVGVAATFGYILTVDLCVLALAYYRRWPVLNWVAALSSWVLFGSFALAVSLGTAVSFASIYQAMFAATSTLNVVRDRSRGGSNLAALFLAVNTLLYLTIVMGLTALLGPARMGETLGAIGAVYLAAGCVLWKTNVRGPFLATVVTIGAGLSIAWVPLELELQWVPAVWAVEGAAALFAGFFVRSSAIRMTGSILLVTSATIALATVGEGTDYSFLRSLAYLAHIVALFSGAFALLRFGEGDEHQMGRMFVVLTNALALVYASLEATAYIDGVRYQMVQFVLTAVWSGYACLLVMVGVLRNSRMLRVLGVGLFGATIVKVVMTDVWLLGTGYRTLVFVGLGVLLLACSLMYSRFKDVLLDERPKSPA